MYYAPEEAKGLQYIPSMAVGKEHPQILLQAQLLALEEAPRTVLNFMPSQSQISNLLYTQKNVSASWGEAVWTRIWAPADISEKAVQRWPRECERCLAFVHKEGKQAQASQSTLLLYLRQSCWGSLYIIRNIWLLCRCSHQLSNCDSSPGLHQQPPLQPVCKVGCLARHHFWRHLEWRKCPVYLGNKEPCSWPGNCLPK